MLIRSSAKGKLFLSVVLCLIVCLSEGALAALEDPTAVRVGEVRYPLSLAQFAYQSAVDASFLTSTEEMSMEDRLSLRDDVITRLIRNAVLENRMRELGQADFTQEETELLQSAAQSRYESLWQALYRRIRESDPDVTEKEVSEWMNEQHYTVDAFYRELRITELQYRAFSLYCRDITVTAKDVADFYDQAYVAPDRERYEKNVPLYESEILLRENEAFFVPFGYRYVKQILLEYPEQLVEQLSPYAARIKDAQNTLDEKYQALAQAAITVDDMQKLVPYRKAWDEAKAVLDQAQEAYLKKREDALPMVQKTVDEIKARYLQGEAFESLMKEYSTDPNYQANAEAGYPFHPDSVSWPEAFREAAAALQKPGDISGPVLTDTGIHIILYASDMACGVHRLTDEEQKALEASALFEARLRRLNTLLDEWQASYQTETHPELIVLD